MKGKPKYKYGDEVKFKFGNELEFTGVIAIIDKWGTWDDPSDVSYDILVEEVHDQNHPELEGKPCLYKHITESRVIELISENNEIKL